MPKILEDAVKRIMSTGKDKSSAYAIATSALQKAGKLKKGSRKLSKKGRESE